jgi:hypothetical protein
MKRNKMKFAIRDDDINYFTRPCDLEKVYRDIWDICPISISIVPFHACTKSCAIPEEFWAGDAIFPIGENKELVKFLKGKIREKKISIMLHGYSHRDYKNGYEFEVANDLYFKVKKGKEYLQELFNVGIKTFVPPHNSLSKEGLDAIIKNGLNLLTIPSFKFRKRNFRFANIFPFLKRKYFLLKYKNDYPHCLDLGNHKEMACCSLIPPISFEELKSRFDFCLKMNGSFCLAIHYWELLKSEKMRKTFELLWEYVNEGEEIEFCEANELFN